MRREWKLGDGAVLRFKSGEIAYGVRRTEGEWTHVGMFGSGSVYDDIGGFEVVAPARIVAHDASVAVIDPEDREAVERLIGLVRNWSDSRTSTTDLWQAALREFANPSPPRISEPGIGGVVEASCVHSDIRLRWLRQAHGEWYPLNATTGADDWASLIDPVLVREGVQP